MRILTKLALVTATSTSLVWSAQTLAQEETGVTPVEVVEPVTQARNIDDLIFYGDPTQPGYQIQLTIFQLVEQGMSLDLAVNQIITQINSDDSTLIGGEAKRLIRIDTAIAILFIGEIARLNGIIDATKESIVQLPSSLQEFMNLGFVLYPDYAQDIITAATLTGEITGEEALLVAINAGVDPTTVSSATAAGGDNQTANVFIALFTPVGSGTGAGGAGGGDTTVSPN
jgi:hypothetical protein